jgi:hypothetical protein
VDHSMENSLLSCRVWLASLTTFGLERDWIKLRTRIIQSVHRLGSGRDDRGSLHGGSNDGMFSLH